MKKPWIASSGSADSARLAEIVARYAEGKKNLTVLRAYTDQYLGCRFEGAIELPDHLLEIRVFDADSELLARRTALGEAFSWRIADDGVIADNLKEEEGFFACPDHYRMEIFQKLDRDEKAKALTTTGGRQYTLPVQGENTIRLVQYLAYDENGLAHAADFRMAGFVSRDFLKEGSDS